MTSLAVLTDIHGNLPALEAVIADAAAAGCDRFVNLGDCLSGPLWPVETADRLIALGWPTIAGNHERQLLGAVDGMGASDRFARERLYPEHMAWVAELPTGLERDGMILCHGTPGDDLQHFLFTVDPDGLRPARPDEIARRAEGLDAQTIFCGHTHLPRTVTLTDGRRVSNPGSVGLQAFVDDRPYRYVVEVGDPLARYAIVADGDVQLRAVPYDHERAAAKAAAEGFGDWACALRTGRIASPE